jgi:hypothetical protein
MCANKARRADSALVLSLLNHLADGLRAGNANEWFVEGSVSSLTRGKGVKGFYSSYKL